MKNKCVIWLTGLPCSGKTTIANKLARKLGKYGATEVLDGDIIRKYLWNDLGFSKEDRITNLNRVIFLAKLLSKHNVMVIIAFVSPYNEVRELARNRFKNFVEVYIKCPLDVCIKRDVKGLYQKAIKGEITDFTGISHPYEEPLKPEVIVETNVLNISDSVNNIFLYLKKNKLI